jgi:hypothetical protein
MLISSLETDINKNGIHMDSDTNDLYVLRKCIIWLQRHIQRYTCFDTETMKLMCWILGEGMQELGTYLLAQLKAHNRARYEEELAESALNPDDYTPEIAKMMRQSPSINKLKFCRHAIRLMNKKLAGLKYNGKSEIEKNIMALRKLFDLTTGRQSCVHFSLFHAYSYAEDYFLSYTECQKFAGQKYLANFLGFSKKELHAIVYGIRFPACT